MADDLDSDPEPSEDEISIKKEGFKKGEVLSIDLRAYGIVPTAQQSPPRSSQNEPLLSQGAALGLDVDIGIVHGKIHNILDFLENDMCPPSPPPLSHPITSDDDEF